MAEATAIPAAGRVRAWQTMLAAGGAGALAGLGQAPVSLPWATLIALGLSLVMLQRCATPALAARIGWATGAGYFAATLFWIVEPFFVDVARHGWMAPFALLGMAGGLALFWGAAWWGAARLGRERSLARALAWAVLLAGAEAARSYLLTGFPWALIGHVWIGWAPMQIAAWTGPIGLTLLTLLLPALVVGLLPRRPVVAGLALIPFAALYGAGAWQAAQPLPAAEDRPVLRLVQPNAAQHRKWDREWAPTFFARQLSLTAAPAEKRPDLIIWPETAVPYILNNAAPALERIAGAAAGVPVALGIQRLEETRAYNSMVVLDGAGTLSALYDKHHLVPFGEYLPFGGLMSRIGLAAFTAQQGYGYSAGPGAQLLDLGALGKALPLICYEAIFPQDLRAAPGRADWILQITNDAWFGEIAGPYQHLAQARLRAVETGLPLVRVANTGVSAVIGPRGTVTASLPLGTHGHVDAALPPPLPETVYARTGDLPWLALLGIAVFGLFALRLGQRS